MKLLRAATLVVSNATAASRRYQEWLDYTVVEEGALSAELAASWGAPEQAGRLYSILAPASGSDIYLRFIEGDIPEDYRPLRTYGWAAIEICVTDVLAVDARMKQPGCPFEIIGPPREIDGLPAIYPMQVKGPDQEIVYLTQIRSDLPSYDLPRAATLIDKLFILVLACSDMKASLAWFEDVVGLSTGREMDIVYTMLANAFDLPVEQLHTIATMVHGRDVFLELDQYPPAATPRPRRRGALPPGVAICTLKHPDFDRVKGPWVSPPVRRDGAIYGGGRVGTLAGPDGTLVEIVEVR